MEQMSSNWKVFVKRQIFTFTELFLENPSSVKIETQ